VLDVKFMVI